MINWSGKSTKGGFFSQNPGRSWKNSMTADRPTAAGKKLFCDCLGGEKRLVICGGGHVSMPVIQLGAMMEFTVTAFRGPSSVCQQCQKSRCPPGDLRLLCKMVLTRSKVPKIPILSSLPEATDMIRSVWNGLAQKCLTPILVWSAAANVWQK